jgi:hypothetical protein
VVRVGSPAQAQAGAPVLDATDERGWETGRWPSALSYRAHPGLYHIGSSSPRLGLPAPRTAQRRGTKMLRRR